MTKRTKLGDQAHELYVVHRLPLVDIATRLGISERTLTNWRNADAKAGRDWEAQRAVMDGATGGLFAELERLAAVVARKIREDLEKPGGQVDDRVYYLDKLLSAAARSLKVTREKPPPKDAASAKDLLQKAAKEVRTALGIE
jgi:hypothetical protein